MIGKILNFQLNLVTKIINLGEFDHKFYSKDTPCFKEVDFQIIVYIWCFISKLDYPILLFVMYLIP